MALTAGQGNDFIDVDAGPRFIDNSLSVTPGAKGSGSGLSSAHPVVWALSSTAGAAFAIDSTNNGFLNRVPVGNGPARIRVAPDVRTVYVTNTLSDSITVVNPSTFQATGTITLPSGTKPTGLAISPDATRLWVIGSAQNSVLVVDAVSKSVIATIPVGSGPANVAITPDGLLAYVANSTAGSLTVIDAFTNQVVKTVSGIPSASGVAFATRGDVAYVTSATSPTGTLYVLNTDDYSIATKVTVGNTPVAVGRDTFGTLIYTVNQGSGDVTLIDGVFYVVAGTVKTGGTRAAIASTP